MNDKTKLLVMPGGRDLPFCQKLNGLGNMCIKKFIESGGSYLGLCAGGYYACEGLEFSKGHPDYEICEDRELKLYPGTAIGPVYPDFVYTSNEGARPVTIKTSNNIENFKGHFSSSTVPRWQSQDIQVYFNGGPYFTYPDPIHKAAKVLACYSTGEPAIVQNIVGNKEGCVILCGQHIEASPSSLRAAYKDDLYIEGLVSSIEATDALRHSLFTSIIQYLLGGKWAESV